MYNSINPLHLVAEKNVKIEGFDKKIVLHNGPACTEKTANGPNHSFVIKVDYRQVENLYQNTWTNTKITFDDFMLGLLFHEVSHIRYESFVPSAPSKGIEHFIFNILEDSRIEYKLSLEFPQFSQYLDWFLISIRLKYNVDGLKNTSNEIKDEIALRLSQLYELARFGVIRESKDTEYLSRILSTVLSSTRGDTYNCIQATNYIANYLLVKIMDKNREAAVDIANSDCVEVEAENSNQTKAFGKCQRVLNNNSSKLNDKISNGIGNRKSKIEIEEKDNSFYIATVEKYKETIVNLRNVFKKYFNEIKISRSFDGDINVLKQQDAYLDSLTMQNGLNYTRIFKEEQSIDLAIVRDISGSTCNFKNQYAEAVICFLASLEGLNGVRTCMIDFGSDFVFVKRFKEELRQSRINPRSGGDTILCPALKALEKEEWKSKNKLVFIITDGGLSDPDDSERKIKELKAKGIFFKKFGVGSYSGKDAANCQIGELPTEIAKIVIRGEHR